KKLRAPLAVRESRAEQALQRAAAVRDLPPHLRQIAQRMNSVGAREPIQQISRTELAALTRATGKEWGVCRDASAQLTLMRGDTNFVQPLAGDKMLAHTHPNGNPNPSGGARDPSGDCANFRQSPAPNGRDAAIVTPNGDVSHYNGSGRVPNDRARSPFDNNG